MQTLGSDLSIDPTVEQLVGVYLDNLSRNPFLPGYLISEVHHHPDRITGMFSAALGAAPRGVMAPLLVKLGLQIDAEVAAGTMRPIAPDQLVLNVLSLCIFPFAAPPMLRVAFGMDDDAFARFIEQRRTELPTFIRNALRP